MSTDSSDSAADNDICWQVVTSPKTRKRKKSESPKIFLNKRKNTNNLHVGLKNNNNTADAQKNANNNAKMFNNIKNNASALSKRTNVIHNKFHSLSDDNDDDDDYDDEDDNEIEEIAKVTTPKPPPIFIPNVTEISAMVKTFSNKILPSSFNYKSLRDGQIRVMVEDIQTYRTLVSYLNDKKIKFHTYQIKQERSYRVVVKNLHSSTPTDEIKNAIERLGHKVRNVTNMRSKITRAPLPMFFVDLEPNPNNKDVYDIKALDNAIVNIVPPKKTQDIVQCHRCQEFGHTKTYCRKSVNCVKCGLGHLTANCSKEKDSPPKCVNCLQSHPQVIRAVLCISSYYIEKYNKT